MLHEKKMQTRVKTQHLAVAGAEKAELGGCYSGRLS